MSAGRRSAASSKARLTARPPVKHRGLLDPGVHSVPSSGHKPASLYVPERASRGERTPLLLLLHGAGASAESMLPVLKPEADRHGFLLLAPQACSYTWDMIASRIGEFSADVEVLDSALSWLFQEVNVDSEKIAIGGFSDGASYALSLGLANGDLFTHVIAFSPGFMRPPDMIARPQIFVSHGSNDSVLPVRCGRKVVEQLQSWKYPVRYLEFNGSHTVPRGVAETAAHWFIPPE